ncbi:MAG: TonB-dependent receptor [Pseudoxanthomonas sp.]
MKLIQRGLVVGMRRALFGGCLLAASAGTAMAQQTGAAPADTTPPAEAEATTLDRIMVTAQSRDQELQDVPIALQVIGEGLIQDLAAENLGDLDSFVPGLVVSDSQPTQANFRLRGISTGDFGIGTDPAVGVYVDGVYAGRGGGTVLPFLDVERVEVLKGPQGTLFGRNSAAGAISVITHRPDTDRTQGRVEARLGNYGKQYLEGMLNLPVGERAAFRFNAVSNQSDGWLHNADTGEDLNGDDDWATRAALRWDFTDNTQALLSWEHEKLDQKSHPVIGIVALPDEPGLPAYPVDEAAYLNPFDQPIHSDLVGNEESRTFDGVTLLLDHSFEWGHLTSTSAWRTFDTVNRAEEDGTNRRYLYIDTANREGNTSWYQEFKFSGRTDKLDWVAGASYYQEEARQSSEVNLFSDTVNTVTITQGGFGDVGGLYSYLDQVMQANGIPLSLLGHSWQEYYRNTLDSKAYALFGDVIWHATDKLNFTFGLRYTRDQKDFTWYNQLRDAPGLDATLDQMEAFGLFDAFGITRDMLVFDVAFTDPVSLANKGITTRASNSWSDVSPRLVVDYHFNEDSMVFASLAKGYKAGGFNTFSRGASIDNEDVWNFETGIKQDFPDQNLQFEASAYYYMYDNRQAIRLDTTPTIPRYLTDTSDQTAFGLDFSARWQPTRALGFDFNAAYIDSTYKNYVTPQGDDLEGEPTGEPSWSFAAGANYDWTLPNDSGVRFSLRHAYRGESRCNEGSGSQGNCGVYQAFTIGKAQNRTDLYARWKSPSDVWGVAVYANNLFDNQYVTGLNGYGTSVFGTTGAGISDPRFYGMELQYQF